MALQPDDVDFDGEDGWPPDSEPAPARVRIIVEADSSEPVLLRTAVSLLLGSAAEGSELLVNRLKLWQAQTEARGQTIYSESPDETEAERLRYTLLGLTARGPRMAQAVLASAVRASDSAYGLVSNVLSPLTGSRLMRPVQRRYDSLQARGATIVERWVDTGRSTEQLSRALAREAAADGTDEAIEEMAGRLAHEPAVRELVTEQGMGMADEVVGAIRTVTWKADTRWEHGVHALFGRRSTVTAPTPSVAAPTPAVTGAAPLPAEAHPGSLQPAGFTSRLLAFLLDVVIVTVGSIILGVLISLVLNFFGLGLQQLKAGSDSQILQLIRLLTVALASLATVLFVPLYFVVFWSLTGATPGKRALGLRVVRPDQRHLSWWRSLLRFIGYFLSAFALFLGFLWVLVDGRRQGWHDKLANSYVVYTGDVPKIA